MHPLAEEAAIHAPDNRDEKLCFSQSLGEALWVKASDNNCELGGGGVGWGEVGRGGSTGHMKFMQGCRSKASSVFHVTLPQ